ncbi:conserved hypothetical protein [uncultured Desulfovibrio sp.]|uniref:Uncharacterized protein n=1 Tax=uncultured Desulfovibrio sp. TaxID=167968 RepID=A0A212J942_9BACT|nr:conserved hypothetical protein [uncultured Desulfovibrio sp.]
MLEAGVHQFLALLGKSRAQLFHAHGAKILRGGPGGGFGLFLGSHLDALPHHNDGLNGQLVSGAGQRLTREVKAHALDFIQHAAGLDRSAPTHGCALTGTLTGFQRLGRYGAVGEHTDPHFAATLDVTHHGDTSSFNLLAGKLAMLHGFKADITKRNGGAAGGQATQAAFLPLAEFNSFGRKHY